MDVQVYCDGACSGNPGPGGWGTIIILRDDIVELSGFEKNTTNNRMELIGAIKGLEWLTINLNQSNIFLKQIAQDLRISIHTDSTYVKNGITEWIKVWKLNNWKTGGNKAVKNRDLWEHLDILQQQIPKLHWLWVRGHSGNLYNEKVDKLARNAIIIKKAL